MLVLSRKAGELIKIGDDVTVEVRRVAGNRVTIAFHAPKEVRILRGELKQATEEFKPSKQAEPKPEAGSLANSPISFGLAAASA